MTNASAALTTWVVEAEVMPKQGVNDPQGDAVMSGLRSLGFAGTKRVRVGKLIRVELDATDESDALEQGRKMCEQLLANPVIEEFTLALTAKEQAS